jgi:hypothetical protein
MSKTFDSLLRGARSTSPIIQRGAVVEIGSDRNKYGEKKHFEPLEINLLVKVIGEGP